MLIPRGISLCWETPAYLCFFPQILTDSPLMNKQGYRCHIRKLMIQDLWKDYFARRMKRGEN